MVRGTGAAKLYLIWLQSTLVFCIMMCLTRPTRPEGGPGLVPRPAQARLFVRPVGSTAPVFFSHGANDVANRPAAVHSIFEYHFALDCIATILLWSLITISQIIQVCAQRLMKAFSSERRGSNITPESQP